LLVDGVEADAAGEAELIACADQTGGDASK